MDLIDDGTRRILLKPKRDGCQFPRVVDAPVSGYQYADAPVSTQVPTKGFAGKQTGFAGGGQSLALRPDLKKWIRRYSAGLSRLVRKNVRKI
ncbi:MAG: hypothetical protein ABJC10_01270 [Acidobacteriota bacterium]